MNSVNQILQIKKTLLMTGALCALLIGGASATNTSSSDISSKPFVIAIEKINTGSVILSMPVVSSNGSIIQDYTIRYSLSGDIFDFLTGETEQNTINFQKENYLFAKQVQAGNSDIITTTIDGLKKDTEYYFVASYENSQGLPTISNTIKIKTYLDSMELSDITIRSHQTAEQMLNRLCQKNSNGYTDCGVLQNEKRKRDEWFATTIPQREQRMTKTDLKAIITKVSTIIGSKYDELKKQNTSGDSMKKLVFSLGYLHYLFEGYLINSDFIDVTNGLKVLISPSITRINSPIDLTIQTLDSRGRIITNSMLVQVNVLGGTRGTDYTIQGLRTNNTYQITTSDNGRVTLTDSITFKKKGNYTIQVTDVSDNSIRATKNIYITDTSYNAESSFGTNEFLDSLCKKIGRNYSSCQGFEGERMKWDDRFRVQKKSRARMSEKDQILFLAELRITMLQNFEDILKTLSANEPLPGSLFASAYVEHEIRSYVRSDSDLDLTLVALSRQYDRGNDNTNWKIAGQNGPKVDLVTGELKENKDIHLQYDRDENEVALFWDDYPLSASTVRVRIKPTGGSYQEDITLVADKEYFRFTRPKTEKITALLIFENGQYKEINIPVGNTVKQVETLDADSLVISVDDDKVDTNQKIDLSITAVDKNGDIVQDYEERVIIKIQSKNGNNRSTANTSKYTLERSSYTFDADIKGRVKISNILWFTEEGDYKVIVEQDDQSSINDSITIKVSEDENNDDDDESEDQDSDALKDLTPEFTNKGDQVEFTRDTDEIDSDIDTLALWYKYEDGDLVYVDSFDVDDDEFMFEIEYSGEYQFTIQGFDNDDDEVGDSMIKTVTID